MVSDTTYIETIEYAEENGDFTNVARLMRLYGEKLKSSKSAGVRDWYKNIRKRAAIAFDYEKSHGRGSLLKLETPRNIRMIALGYISPEEIEAARRHREQQLSPLETAD